MLNSFALASKQFSKVLICSDIISFQSSDPKHLALIFFLPISFSLKRLSLSPRILSHA